MSIVSYMVEARYPCQSREDAIDRYHTLANALVGLDFTIVILAEDDTGDYLVDSPIVRSYEPKTEPCEQPVVKLFTKFPKKIRKKMARALRP